MTRSGQFKVRKINTETKIYIQTKKKKTLETEIYIAACGALLSTWYWGNTSLIISSDRLDVFYSLWVLQFIYSVVEML